MSNLDSMSMQDPSYAAYWGSEILPLMSATAQTAGAMQLDCYAHDACEHACMRPTPL